MMAESEMPEKSTSNTSSKEIVAADEEEEEEQKGMKGQQNKDMSNMYGFDDYKELLYGNNLDNALKFIKSLENESTLKVKTEKELEIEKIVIVKDDFELIISEIGCTKAEAEKALRMHGGDVEKTLSSFIE